MQIRRAEKCVWQNRTAEREENDLGLQDDRMSGNIQDIARLITRLLLKGDMPQYTLPAAEADYTEAVQLFKKVIGLADEGDINVAENELLMNMEEDDPEYLELALTFYLYLNDMDGDYLDDLRLYIGAIVHISSQTTITLYSDNAQTENILYENNPLAGQEPLVVKKDLTVGPDLPAGVYDLILVSGEGSVDVDIYTEYGESMETKDLYLGENCTDGKEYKNLVLPKNAQITLDDNMELRLTPSEHISTTDYYEYYNY